MTAAAQTADPQASLAPLGPAFPPDFPPVWASAWGEDVYGWYADFVVGEVWQRCRWIPPGRFWMGSPALEEGREAFGHDESLHLVTLTQGFWLADTACTQALWQAVMGENPARFGGENADTDQYLEHPVERVSWNNIASGMYGTMALSEACFLKRLNLLVPGLEAGLPSESQWEWACRADSRILSDNLPFAFGKTITVQQANFDGRYPYGDAPKGEFRNCTVPVKAFKPNAWGLYQMHGNVWEWCRDWLASYPVLLVVDPEGPPSGGVGSVACPAAARGPTTDAPCARRIAAAKCLTGGTTTLASGWPQVSRAPAAGRRSRLGAWSGGAGRAPGARPPPAGPACGPRRHTRSVWRRAFVMQIQSLHWLISRRQPNTPSPSAAMHGIINQPVTHATMPP